MRRPLQAAGRQATIGPDQHVSRHIQKTGLGQPDKLVAAPIPAGEPAGPAGGEVDAPSGKCQVFGDLPS